MKMDKKTINLIIGLIGIIILVVAYMAIAKPMKEKTAQIEAENVGLKEKADEYEAVNAQRPKYEQGIVDLTATREELLASFPAGMTREDEIMYWANMERANYSVLNIDNLVMSSWSEVFVDGQPSYSDEEGATQLHLYSAPVNYTYQATYQGVKDMVSYVFAQTDKKSIENLAVSYDTQTGNLVGTIDINMYYMVGTGNEYKPYTIPSVPTGVTDVFHSNDILSDGSDISGFGSGEAESDEADE